LPIANSAEALRRLSLVLYIAKSRLDLLDHLNQLKHRGCKFSDSLRRTIFMALGGCSHLKAYGVYPLLYAIQFAHQQLLLVSKATQQLARTDPERPRDPKDGRQLRVVPAVFDVADLNRVHACGLGKPLLRPLASVP
jgi:hypothetical protein